MNSNDVMVLFPLHFVQAEYVQKYISRGAGVMCYEAPVFRRDKPDMTYTRQNIVDLVTQVGGAYIILMQLL